MKKMLAVLSAGVLAAGMCAGFVACGDGGVDLGIDENTVFADIVSDKVTEQQWNDAFDMKNWHNYYKNYKYHYYSLNAYGRGHTEIYADVAGDKLYCKYKTIESEDEEKEFVESYLFVEKDYNYDDIVDEDNYDAGEPWAYGDYLAWAYFYEDGVWTRDNKERVWSDNEGDDDFAMRYGHAVWYPIPYSMVKYDEELKGYVPSFYYDDDDENITYVFKFKGGKYCGYEICIDGERCQTTIMYDYGKAKVTLPKVEE